MAIHESAENYLETILMLSQIKPEVRSIDIANELNFFKTKRQRCHEKSAQQRSYPG